MNIVKVMNMKELLSREEIRMNSYKLLSDCYHVPDEQLMKILCGLDRSPGGLFSEIAEIVPGISDTESLIVDYAKLFVGPYGLLAPPYGSVYLEDAGKIMGNSTIDVLNKYREEGLSISLKEIPDHIALELEFMYFLIFKEVEAFRDSDFENIVSYIGKQKVFLETHLGTWVSDFADNVKANAWTEFYKNLARLTKSFVETDLEILSSHNADLPLYGVRS